MLIYTYYTQRFALFQQTHRVLSYVSVAFSYVYEQIPALNMLQKDTP